MIRGTTPTLVFGIPFSVGELEKVKVVFSQGNVNVLCKETGECQMSDHSLSVKLTQEETFLFDCEKLLHMQLRARTKDGSVLASNIVTTKVNKCLDDEVL